MAQNNLEDGEGGVPIPATPGGRSAQALGTSKNSDSGSDVVGTLSRAELQSDSDANGTGEGADVERDNAGVGGDIRPDRVRGVDGIEAPGTLDSDIDQLASDDDAEPGEAPSV